MASGGLLWDAMGKNQGLLMVTTEVSKPQDVGKRTNIVYLVTTGK